MRGLLIVKIGAAFLGAVLGGSRRRMVERILIGAFQLGRVLQMQVFLDLQVISGLRGLPHRIVIQQRCEPGI